MQAKMSNPVSVLLEKEILSRTGFVCGGVVDTGMYDPDLGSVQGQVLDALSQHWHTDVL